MVKRQYTIISLIFVSLCKVLACSDKPVQPYCTEQIILYEVADRKLKTQLENFLNIDKASVYTYELSFEYYTREIVIMKYPHILLPKEMIHGVVVINNATILITNEVLTKLSIFINTGITIGIEVCHPTNVYSVDGVPIYCSNYDVDEPLRLETFKINIDHTITNDNSNVSTIVF